MCGICCFIGNFPGIEYVLNGLIMLLNRGYDSTGICGIDKNNRFLLYKYATTKFNNSIDLVKNHNYEYSNLVCPLIAHSRWATCGINNNINAHPHIDYTLRFSLVHNGIIENHNEIRNMLINNHSIKFKSQTDTEVIVNLISVMYDQHLDIQVAITNALHLLKGSWAISLISTLEPNKLYCICNGVPLLVGYGNNFMMVASEKNGFLNYVSEYIVINDNDLIVLEKNNNTVIINKKIDYIPKPILYDTIETSSYPFPYWTIKEIYEQYEASIKALGNYSRIESETNINLYELNRHDDKLTNADNLILLGCGTSYHAGLYISSLFKKISGFNTIQVFDGAEFNIDDIPKIGTTILIFISQSGETKDLFQCIDIGKKNNLCMIGIINAVDSFISRSMNYNIYLNCGIENAVASTKAFTNQVIILSMLSVWFAQIKNINVDDRINIIKSLNNLPRDIKNTIDKSSTISKSISKKIVKAHPSGGSIFVIGKGSSEIIAKEGALKIKEISYIHAEAYNSSSLKHGPFSLLVNDVPVIMIALNDDNFNKNMSIAEEIIARNTKIFGISDIELDDKFVKTIIIPKNNIFGPLLANIPLQLIAYEIALAKNLNPDKPKNLAKVITV